MAIWIVRILSSSTRADTDGLRGGLQALCVAWMSYAKGGHTPALSDSLQLSFGLMSWPLSDLKSCDCVATNTRQHTHTFARAVPAPA